MFRTITALLIVLVVSVVIGVFQILALDIAALQAIINDPNVTDAIAYQGAMLFGQLIFPYTFALSGQYGPLVALGVAGFIGGLISKSGVRMLFVSVIAMGLFFLGYALLTVGLSLEWSALYSLARNIVIDLGVSFALLFIPGIIGASMTSEEY